MQNHPSDKTRTEAVSSGQKPPSRQRWRKAFVATSILAGMLGSGVALTPGIVLHSGYRDVVLTRVLGRQKLSVTSTSGSGGWLTPIRIDGIRLIDRNEQVEITISSLQLSKSVFELIRNRSDLGQIAVIQPKVHIRLNEDGKLTGFQSDPEADSSSGENPKRHRLNVEQLQFDIVDSSFRLDVPWRKLPIVDLNSIDISGQITTDADGKWLSVNPIEIFNHQPLSREHSEQNLAMIAPILSQVTQISGEVSVHLNAVRHQLDGGSGGLPQLSGSTVFHSMNAELLPKWSNSIRRLMSSSTTDQLPARLEIAKDSGVTFKVDADGVHHQGLAFLLPDIARDLRIESSGVVHTDESLDMNLSVQLPHGNGAGSFLNMLTRMTRIPISLRVVGTVSEPKLVMPEGLTMLDDLSMRLSPDGTVEPPKEVPGAVKDLIRSAVGSTPGTPPDQLTGNIIELIRAIRQSKNPDEPTTDDEPRTKRRKKQRAATP